MCGATSETLTCPEVGPIVIQKFCAGGIRSPGLAVGGTGAQVLEHNVGVVALRHDVVHQLAATEQQINRIGDPRDEAKVVAGQTPRGRWARR